MVQPNPRLVLQMFLVALASWVLSGMVLDIPHGPGHSIENLPSWLTVLNDWAGRLSVALGATLLGLLVLQVILDRSSRGSTEG